MKRKTILVVDDDKSTRTLLNCMLNKQFDVTTRKDGMEGMVWLDFGNLPDLILMDIDMPHFNGFDFLDNLRKSGFYRSIPVVALSGTDKLGEVDRFFKLGGNAFLKKPFNPSELFSTLNKHIALN
ncbi:MAG: response regulator [Sphingobacteriales bacterium]|nr:MAG: response regulator [Sphingobacteriales bacterium]